MERPTSHTKSFDSSFTMPTTLAPITLRIPISRVRCAAMKVVTPKSPIQEMKIAISIAVFMICAVFCSLS
jgi:hypothetical protein